MNMDTPNLEQQGNMGTFDAAPETAYQPKPGQEAEQTGDMWMLRVLSKAAAWLERDAGNPESIRAAAEELEPRERGDGAGLEKVSFYRVQDQKDAHETACIFALTQRPDPRKIAYVLLPTACFTACKLTPASVPDPKLPAWLRERHFELDLSSADKRKELVEAAFQDSQRHEILAPEIKENGRRLTDENADLREYIIEHDRNGWLKFLKR